MGKQPGGRQPEGSGGRQPGKRRLQGAERREQILDAATAVFGRLGYEATRMDDVAKEAGIAKGLLYKHFPSKDALFEALIGRQGQAYAAELRDALGQADVVAHPQQALQAGLAFWLDKLRDPAVRFNVSDPGVHDAYDRLRNSLRDVIAEALRSADPDLADPYARLIAALLQGAAENLGLAWRVDPGPVAAEEALALLTAFCWGGLQALGGVEPGHRGGPRSDHST